MRPASAWKLALIGAGIVGLVLAATATLRGGGPQTVLTRIRSLLGAKSRAPAPSLPAAAGHATPEESVPLFSDLTFDDSGYEYAAAFSAPIKDPSSLIEMRDSVVGRGRRGIAFMEAKLAALDPADPATPFRRMESHMFIGALLMHEGDWIKAAAGFAQAQTADPSLPHLALANLDALRGVAALRRGEIENCVACCNESSCIFPLGRRGRPSPDRRLARGDPPLHRATSSSGPKTWASGGS